MKISRGGKTKSHYDYETVATQDLSNSNEEWTEKREFDLNNTIDSFAQRKSVSHLEINERDILALNAGLVNGLYKEVVALRFKTKKQTVILNKIESQIALAEIKDSDEIIAVIKNLFDK